MVTSNQLSPLESIWARLESNLQDGLYGAYKTHGIISTRKAFAALEGINNKVGATFMKMESTEIPFEGQHSKPTSNWKNEDPPFYINVTLSPCVTNACRRLNNETEGKITSDLFFVYLVQTSTGPTVQRWKTDGYPAIRITEMFYAD